MVFCFVESFMRRKDPFFNGHHQSFLRYSLDMIFMNDENGYKKFPVHTHYSAETPSINMLTDQHVYAMLYLVELSTS